MQDEKNLSPDVSSLELLLSIRKKIWLIIPLSAIIFIGTYWYAGRYIFYESYATFFMNSSLIPDQSYSEDENSDAMLRQSVGTNRMNQLVYSNDLISYLIKQLDLYKYYGIDTTSEFHYEKIYEILRSRISFIRSPNNLITIKAGDRDRYMAASIANETVSRLNYLNKKLLSEQLQDKINVLGTFLDSVHLEAFRQTINVDSAKKALHEYLLTDDRKIISQRLEEIQHSYSELWASLKNSGDEAIRLRKSYEWSLKVLNTSKASSLTIVHLALPDSHSVLPTRLSYAFFLTITIMVFLLVLFYFLKKYKEIILLLIKGK